MTPYDWKTQQFAAFIYKLRSTTAIANSKLFPTIYQRTRAWDKHRHIYNSAAWAPSGTTNNLTYDQKCNLRQIIHGKSL